MFHSFSKVFDLIKKTGDRCIVLPENGEDVYVIMSLAEYERLALRKSDVTSLTEDELLDRINRDIAIWKTQQETDGEKETNNNWLKNKKQDYSPWAEEGKDFEADEDDDLAEDPYYFESIDR